MRALLLALLVGVSSLMSATAQVLEFRSGVTWYDLTAHPGPIGTIGRSITALRSVAVDPAQVPRGAPVWVGKKGSDPMHLLMVAQYTSGVIKGAQRADILYGTGHAAGLAAGAMKDEGRLVLLLPIDRAFALLMDG